MDKFSDWLVSMCRTLCLGVCACLHPYNGPGRGTSSTRPKHVTYFYIFRNCVRRRQFPIHIYLLEFIVYEIGGMSPGAVVWVHSRKYIWLHTHIELKANRNLLGKHPMPHGMTIAYLNTRSMDFIYGY